MSPPETLAKFVLSPFISSIATVYQKRIAEDYTSMRDCHFPSRMPSMLSNISAFGLAE
jgi:hypothetical protein